jgi:hypothetical protein
MSIQAGVHTLSKRSSESACVIRFCFKLFRSLFLQHQSQSYSTPANYISLYIIIYTYVHFLPWLSSPQWAKASLLSRIHYHILGLLWASDQPDAKTCTSQHTTLTTDRQPRPRRDSNQQSQQASDRRPTPETARSLTGAYIHVYIYVCIYIYIHISIYNTEICFK